MMDYKQTLMWKEINETKDILEKILPANKTVLAKIAQLVKERKIRHVVLASRGTSRHAGIYFKYLAEIFTDMIVTTEYPSVITVYNGKVNYKDALVIGISQSGRAADAIEILKRAKKHGALTMSITNNSESDMAKTGEFHLCLNAGDEKSVAATKTFTAQLYLLALLALMIADDKTKLKQLENMAQKIKTDIAKIDELSTQAVEGYQNMRDGFILARGITYPIALEAALKLQETSYLKMQGYAISDFYHGPMAMVEEGAEIIVYASKIGFVSEVDEAAHFVDIQKFLDRVNKLKANVLIITDDIRYKDKNKNIIMLPKGGNEINMMIYFAVFAQMFTCKLAGIKGNNPDTPRSLKKVTITK